MFIKKIIRRIICSIRNRRFEEKVRENVSKDAARRAEALKEAMVREKAMRHEDFIRHGGAPMEVACHKKLDVKRRPYISSSYVRDSVIQVENDSYRAFKKQYAERHGTRDLAKSRI